MLLLFKKFIQETIIVPNLFLFQSLPLEIYYLIVKYNLIFE
jgi:hypothetical protein